MNRFLAALLASSSWAMVAHAQTAGTPAAGQAGTASPAAEGGAQAQNPTAAPATPETGLAEIVVTAQRRSQNLQSVPISVAVATASQLRSAGVADVSNLKMIAPGVEVQTNNGYALPVIRGVGSKNTGAGIETPIAIYIDGVYFAAASSAFLSFNNIAQVEVLKGPQGTLFGRNATGGLIQVTTRDPGAQLAGEVNLTYGNYRTGKADGYVSGGIAKGLAADLALSVTAMGNGYGTNRYNGKDVYRTNHDVAARSKWVWNIDDSTVAHLIFDFQDQDTSQFTQALPPGSTAPAPYGPNAPNGSPWDVNLDQQPMLHIRAGGVSLRLDHDFGPIKIASISAYRDSIYSIVFDYDYTATRGRVFPIDQRDRQFSQELQLLSTSSSPLSYVLGAYYFRAEGRYDTAQIQLFGPSVGAGALASVGTSTFSRQETDSIASFGQATLKLLPNVNLTAGLRYTSEERALNDATLITNRADGSSVVTLPASSRSTRFNKLTWRLALDYRITPLLLTYVSYNRGFRSGGFNPLNLTLPPFQPEQLDAYEAGFKATLLDRKVRFNSAFYYYDYQNIQLSISAPAGSGIYNGSSAKVYGLDSQLDAQITGRLRATVGYQYAHGRYGDFPGAVIASNRAAGGQTISIGNAAGNTTLLTPTSTVSTALDYTMPIGDKQLDLNVSWYHNSGLFNDPDNYTRQPAYDLVNTSARIKLNNGLAFSIWGKNLTNAAVTNVDSIQNLGGGLGIRRATYQPPRTYGVTVGHKF